MVTEGRPVDGRDTDGTDELDCRPVDDDVGIGAEDEASGIPADNAADDGMETEGMPMPAVLPNLRSSPPNCTSSCVTLSPGISTAEVGILEAGGILDRICVDETADDDMPKEAAGDPFDGCGGPCDRCCRPRPAGPLGDPPLAGLC
jgi:hypothetical protein